MATPHAVLSPAARLPVELVEMICNELAVLEQRLCQAGTLQWHQGCQCAALAAAACVSRKWTGPARTALLRSVYFRSPAQGAGFLAAMEHNSNLLSLVRAVEFQAMGCKPHPPPDMRWIPAVLEKCHNVELVCIYAETNVESPGFEYAIRNMKHLRTFIFESNPAFGNGGNEWFRVSARHLPAQLRVLRLEDSSVDLNIVHDMLFDLDLLEYQHLGADASLVTDAPEGLLESSRPFRVSKFSVYVEPDEAPAYVDGQIVPQVSTSEVESLTARFASRGVVFKLLESPWHQSWGQ